MQQPELPSFMYVSADDHDLSHHEQAELVCKGGCRLIQLRTKDQPYERWKLEAEKVKEICKRYDALLIINDSVPVVMEAGADGVHLGKEDMDPVKARELMGAGYLIGGTANTFGDVERLHDAAVNYIGLGPFRFTASKKNLAPVLGLEKVKEIMDRHKSAGIRTPIFAIGGIKPEDVSALMKTGIHGIAISSYVLDSEDPSRTVEELIKQTSIIQA